MMDKFYSWPIRIHLTLLIALLAVPSITLIIYSGRAERREAIAGAKSECLKFVNNVAAQQQAIVAGAEQLATALSLLPPVQSRNPDVATALFSELLKKNPQYASISVTDASGFVWASATPFEGKISLADRRYFQEAVRTGMFSSGEFLVGRMVKKPLISFGYPVKNATKGLIAVIVVVLDLNYAQAMFEKIGLPSGASFSLLDHQGIVLIRNLKDAFSEKLVGRRDIRGDNFTKMTEGPEEGTFESVGNDDIPRFVAYKRISLPHESKPYLYVRSSIPRGSATSKANAAMLRNLSVFASLLLAGLLLAWFIGKRIIVTPVMMLKRASEQLAAGTDTVNVSHRVKGGELGELARAFDGMADALVQRETAKNAVEAALRESEQRWATTLSSVGDAVIATDIEGKITFMNAAAEAVTGWTISEAAMKPATVVFNIVNEHTRRQVESPITKVLREGKVVGLANHTILVRKDGREVPIDDSGAPIRDREGKTLGVVLVFHDITERKQAEEALRESETRLRRLYESGLLGVIYWNMNGEIKDANDKFLEMVRYGREDLAAGRIDWVHMTPPEYRHLDEKSAVELRGTGVNRMPFEKEYIRKDGTRIPIVIAGAMLDEARFNGVAFVLDISERKRAEEALRHRTLELQHLAENLEKRVSERTAELAALSSQLVSAQEDERRRVSYDLHDNVWQALVAIRFEIERLFFDFGGADRTSLQDRAKKIMAAILDTVGKIRSMQGDLWPYLLDDIGILATIDWYCREFEKDHPGLTIERQGGLAENDILQSAKIVLYRVLQETLSNVEKHSQASHVMLRLKKVDHRMEFTVEDNGIGFDAEEMFAKRSPWGGLGLLSVKARAELSGGRFGVESVIGRGTMVRVSWPFQEDDPNANA
jgi:two-component system, cell cycle sensor histidine kinase and response regulator CckA